MVHKLSSLFLIGAFSIAAMDLVTLKNGTTAEKCIVNVTMTALSQYSQEAPEAIQALIRKARNPEYHINEQHAQFLAQRGLLKPEGALDERICNIILCATEGTSATLTFKEPINPLSIAIGQNAVFPNPLWLDNAFLATLECRKNLINIDPYSGRVIPPSDVERINDHLSQQLGFKVKLVRLWGSEARWERVSNL